MAGIELATAYVSIVPETSKLEAGLKAALNGTSKNAGQAGTEIGQRMAESASKALKSGWKPDQDIMAGIPDTKLDRIGARIGQVIGKGVVAGMKANEAGQKFANGFSQGASSVGIGKIVSSWKSQLSSSSLSTIGAAAGKTLMAGVTGAATLGLGTLIGGIGTALTKGFDRLLTIDKSKRKLEALGKSTAEVSAIVKTVTDSVTGTPFSLDAAFATAVQAIGAGTADIGKFMQNVVDAAGFAGTDIQRMGLIFNQVLAKGKLTGEEMMQLMEAGLPAKSWIQKSYNLTTDQFESMQEKGQITLDMLQKAIEDNAQGMGKSLGDSLQGSIDKMQTAIARLGANFLAAIFGGDASEATDTMADSIQKVTDKLNAMDTWVKNNGPAIQGTFQTIGNAIGAAFKAGSDAIQTFIDDTRMIATLISKLLGAMASVSEFMDKIPGVGGNGQEATTLREWQQSLMSFANPDDIGSGARPNAQRERRGYAPVVGSNEGLRPNAITLKDSIASMFPEIREIGGFRPNDPFPDHPSGRAIDVMIPPELVGTPEGKALGDRINQFALSSGLAQYTMWEQQQFNAGGGISPMPDRSHMGNPTTQNHFDHIHIYTNMGSPQVLNGAVPQMGEVQGGSPTGSDLLKRLAGVGGFAGGGAVRGAGSGKSDSIVGRLSHGEHVLSASDVNAMGGQGAVYNFRKSLPGFAKGGSVNQRLLEDMRTAGAIPAGAGDMSQAGTSSIASLIDIGGEVINSVIDQAASAASTAASAGVTAGTMGAGGGPLAGQAAGQAVQAAIGIGTSAAKRGVTYGFDMAGIGVDSLLNILTPFGKPRWLSQDYRGFMPQWDMQGALGNLMSGGAQAAVEQSMVDPNTTMHGQGMGGLPGPVDPMTTMHGQGGLPGPPMFNDTASSFLSTELAQPEVTPANVQPMFKVDNIYTTDAEAVGRELTKRGNLAQMQYTGRP